MLVSGTVGAHLITASAMPILSRLYGPAEFGALAVFTAVVMITSSAACLRYDVAVALPEQDVDALGLVVLALLCATAVSAISFVAIAFASASISRWFDQPEISAVLWWVPLGVFCAAAWNALQAWNIRHQRFSLIARVRVGQSLTGSSLQVGAGFLGTGAAGLVVGYAVNFAFATILLGARLAQETRTYLWALSLRRLWQLALAYRRFPLFSTWEALANNAAIHLPIMFIASLATTQEAGYLMLAMYLVQAPMGLIGSAVGQVYLSHAAQAHRSGNLGTLTIEILGKLIKVGIGPLLALAVLAPMTIELLFGAGWQRAGWLVVWMTPWFAFQFLASPLSMALHILGRQRAALILQVLALSVRLATVCLVSVWWDQGLTEAYAVSGAIVYAVYLYVVLVAVGTTPAQWMRAFLGGWRWIAYWAAATTFAAAVLTSISGIQGQAQ